MTKQSEKDFELVHKIKKTANLIIFSIVAFIIALILNLCVISYNSTTKLQRISYLYFIQDQNIIFALFVVLAK